MHTALSTAIDHYLRSVYPADEPGAGVIVVHNGRVMLREAYGVADGGSGRPLTPDDVFHIASITKNFTAAVVLQLVDRGVLALDDHVEHYLPEVPATWRGMTVRHLLTHTSGLVDFTELLPAHSGYVHHHTLFAKVRSEPLVAPPGEQWAYSNTGYLLLGLILERHTGQPWGEYMERQFYRPLGMSRTVYAGRLHPRLVSGHWRNGDRIEPAPAPSPTPYAAGATLSSVDDLVRWIAALEGSAVLSSTVRTESVRRVRMNDGTTGSSGMGWLLSSFGRYEVHWHSGDITGYASMLLRIPTQRLLVIVLSNNEAARERPMFVGLHVAELALGDDWSYSIHVTAEKLEPLVGVYRNGRGDTHILEVKKDGRICIRNGEDAEQQELVPLSATEFVGEMGMRVRFFSESGRPAMLLRPVFGKEELAHRIEAAPRTEHANTT